MLRLGKNVETVNLMLAVPGLQLRMPTALSTTANRHIQSWLALLQ